MALEKSLAHSDIGLFDRIISHRQFLRKMKRKLHRVLVRLSLLVVVPTALFTLVVLIASIGSSLTLGFSETDLVAFPYLILPSIMVWWASRLVFRLYGGFSMRIRREVLLYHGVNLCYCSLWLLVSTYNGDSFFGLQERLIGISILSVPLLIALFTRVDENQQSIEE